MANDVDITFTEPQAEFMALTCKYPAFVAGYGCLRGSTKILTISGLVAIEDISCPTLVVSWNEKSNQYQLSLTGGAYIKGKDYLYQVVTTQGEFVASGSHHVFCADYRYQPVSSLNVGDEVLQEPLNQLVTISEFAQLKFPIGADHLSQTNVNYLGDYADAARQYGQQLQSVLNSDQSFAQEQDGAQGLHQINGGKGDQQGQVLKHSHHDRLLDLLSKRGYSLHGEDLEVNEEDHVLSSSPERTLQNNQQFLQSREMSECHHRERQLNQHCSDKHPLHPFTYSSNKTVSKIISIKRLESQEVYWDLQVLDTNNYVCESGFIHHNSGKSEIMTTAAVIDAGHSSSAVIALYEPTFDLVTLMLAPRMEAKLQHFGIRYTYNKQDHIIYTSNSQFGDFVFRSMDKPERIIAYESYRCHLDELDTLKQKHAQDVWRKILGRNRQVPKDLPDEHKIKNTVTGRLEAFNRASVYTTPEGYRFVYDRWKKRGGKDYGIVHASTESNPFVEDSFVQGLREDYPAELAEAYINGQFTNLTTGTVYDAYNRKIHRSDETIQRGETLFIGCDFNIQRMCFTVYVKRDAGREWHIVDEGHNLYNTSEVVKVLCERYKDQGHRVVVYPDASGNNRKSSAASTDITLLRDAGFEIRAPRKNPDVRDRIQCFNRAISNGKIKINDRMCPNVANCLEQQTYTSKGEPDKDSGVDDQNDATTYPIAYEMPIRKAIFNIDFDFSFQS